MPHAIMCLAIPGKVVAIKDGVATIDYSGERRAAIAKGVELKEGDYALVQFGMVVQRLEKEDALQAIRDWKAMDSRNR